MVSTPDILTHTQPPIQCVRTSFLASFASSAGKKNISTSKLVKSRGDFILASHQFWERVCSLAKVMLCHIRRLRRNWSSVTLLLALLAEKLSSTDLENRFEVSEKSGTFYCHDKWQPWVCLHRYKWRYFLFISVTQHIEFNQSSPLLRFNKGGLRSSSYNVRYQKAGSLFTKHGGLPSYHRFASSR